MSFILTSVSFVARLRSISRECTTPTMLSRDSLNSGMRLCPLSHIISATTVKDDVISVA